MSRIVEVTDRVSVRAAHTNRQRYGPGTHEVPDDVAEDLLSHRAVQEPDQSEHSDNAEDGDDWDAADFVDEHHATVRNAVEDGEADGHLQAVEDAENARDSPRDSVLQSINDRQEQVQG